LTLHHVDDEGDRIVLRACAETLAASSPAPNVDGRVSGSDHLAQQQAETFVRSGDAPTAVRSGVDAVVEPRPTATTARREILRDEFGFDQLRQMLADGVVIEAEVFRELGNIDWRARVGDVTKDSMARRVAERSCLFLKRRHRVPTSIGIPVSVRQIVV
jgi:hypothetical protein